MHYYNVRCLENDGSVVRLEAVLVHPDVETFGTERYFAWKLLSELVSPEDDGDDAELARKYVKRVEVGPLAHGTVSRRGPGWFSVKQERDDEDAKRPTVVYTIEVSDPSLLAPLEVGDSEESVAYVEPDKVILDEPASGSAWRRFECTEGGSQKFWEIRLDGSMVHLRWGKLGTEGRSQDDDWLSPARAEKAHKKLVAQKVKKGYVERSAAAADARATVEPARAKGKADKGKAPKAKATKADATKGKATKGDATKGKAPRGKATEGDATKGKATRASPKGAEPPAEAKTHEDLRKLSFELIRAGSHWPDAVIAFLVRWAEDASDEQVMSWLEELSPFERGWFSQAAGRVAAERAQAGKTASAKRFLKAGEEALPTEEKSHRARATLGLMPAWWRLGDEAKAERAWTELPADPESYLSRDDLGWVAALGGQVDRFVEVGRIGRLLDFATADGLTALYRDGEEIFRDAVDRCEDKAASEELSVALLRRALRDGRPGAFVALALAYPDVLIGRGAGEPCVTVALHALARTEPAEAIKLALRVLDEEPFSFAYGAHLHAFALVAAHAPKQAERWARGREEMADDEDERRHAYVAALGRTAEVRAVLPELDGGMLLKVACTTPERALALEALRAHVAARKLSDVAPAALLRLCNEGERARVDELLVRELGRLEALAPKERDLGCRTLCRLAAVVGNVELARKACKLPVKSVRANCVYEIVVECSRVGDFAGAVAALEILADDADRWQAVHGSLCAVESAFVLGPRATPFRSMPWARAPLVSRLGA